MLCALGLSSAHVPLSQPDFPLTVAPRGTRLQSHLALPQVLVCTRLPASHSVPASPAAREAPARSAPWRRLHPGSMLAGLDFTTHEGKRGSSGAPELAARPPRCNTGPSEPTCQDASSVPLPASPRPLDAERPGLSHYGCNCLRVCSVVSDSL